MPINFVDYGDESDPGPVPDPGRRAGRGRQRPARARRRPRQLQALRAVRRPAQGNRWDASSGAVFDLRSNALRPDGWTSADAAGLPIFPGLVRYDEVASGHINHALRFTVCADAARLHPPGDALGVVEHRPEPPADGLAAAAEGELRRVGLPGQARVVLDALKKYGMIVADNGSNWFVSGAADSRWNDNDLNQLKTDARAARSKSSTPARPSTTEPVGS